MKLPLKKFRFFSLAKRQNDWSIIARSAHGYLDKNIENEIRIIAKYEANPTAQPPALLPLLRFVSIAKPRKHRLHITAQKETTKSNGCER